MPAICVANGCSNKGGHFFPRDPGLLKKWLIAVNRPGFMPTRHSRLCSAHFLDSDFNTEGFYTGIQLTKKILKKDAVPSVFLGRRHRKPTADSVKRSTKRKLEEPVTNKCVKSNKVILLIQNPGYDEPTKEKILEPEVDSDEGTGSFCAGIDSEEKPIYPLPDEYEAGGDVLEDMITLELECGDSNAGGNSELVDEPSVFEYDVTSRPSLREVSTKSQNDALQDRVYTSEQRDVVIDKLNSVRSDESVRKLLGPKLTKAIEAYLNLSGSFSKLDELLKVQTVGPKTVRTLCDKLLGITVEKRSKSRSSSPTSAPLPVRKGRSTAYLVSPPLTDEFCMTVNLLGAIVVDVTSVSWVLTDSKTKTLIDWKTLSVDVPLVSLRDVVVKASAIEKELPEADLFVLEDPSLSSRGSHHFQSYFTCALASAIHTRREVTPGVVKMAFMKNRLVEKHFNASVGSETVSLQPFLQDVMDLKVAVGRSNLFISQDLTAYYKTLDPLAREQLSRAGLLSITCMDLVLNRRDTLDRRKPPEDD